MNQLSIENIVRYLTVGIVVIVIAYICEPAKTTCSLEKFGIIGTPLLAFAIGALSFHIYRPTVYRLILKGIDRFFYKENVRQKIIDSCTKIKKRQDAEVFWSILKRRYLSEEFKRIDLESSEVHLLYLTSISCIIGSGYCYIFSSNNIVHLLILLISFPVIFIAAILNDIRVEEIESRLYSTISKKDKEELYKSLYQEAD